MAKGKRGLGLCPRNDCGSASLTCAATASTALSSSRTTATALTFKERIEGQQSELQRKESNRAKITRDCDSKIASAESASEKARAKLAREEESLRAVLQDKEFRVAEQDRQVEEAEANLAKAISESQGFRDRVVREGLDWLNEHHAFELLLLLGVTVDESTVTNQGIIGSVLPDISEEDMQQVFEMSKLGPRRRLSIAIRDLVNLQGFTSDALSGCRAWSPTQVTGWLDVKGLSELGRKFTEHDIDGIAALELTPSDFALLGCTTLGLKSKLKKEVELLKKQYYAGQTSDGGGSAEAGGGLEVSNLRAVLAAVLEENSGLQTQVERSKELYALRGKITPQFLCPILQEVMDDPVIAMDGNTYERSAIGAWFQRSDRSPMTNLVVQPVLVPNIQLRQLIAELEEDA
jgi:hypothetical protein